jgi:hypothetical protein
MGDSLNREHCRHVRTVRCGQGVVVQAMSFLVAGPKRLLHATVGAPRLPHYDVAAGAISVRSAPSSGYDRPTYLVARMASRTTDGNPEPVQERPHVGHWATVGRDSGSVEAQLLPGNQARVEVPQVRTCTLLNVALDVLDEPADGGLVVPKQTPKVTQITALRVPARSGNRRAHHTKSHATGVTNRP